MSSSPNDALKPGVNSCILDSSAVLALMNGEAGADAVMAALPGACLSSVNFAEVVSRLCERGMPAAEARLSIEALELEIIPFEVDQATRAGGLRTETRALGLSLGDRACLAVARGLDLPVLTADRAWGQLSGFNITIIR